jgi:hypothetical protein
MTTFNPSSVFSHTPTKIPSGIDMPCGNAGADSPTSDLSQDEYDAEYEPKTGKRGFSSAMHGVDFESEIEHRQISRRVSRKLESSRRLLLRPQHAAHTHGAHTQGAHTQDTHGAHTHAQGTQPTHNTHNTHESHATHDSEDDHEIFSLFMGSMPLSEGMGVGAGTGMGGMGMGGMEGTGSDTFDTSALSSFLCSSTDLAENQNRFWETLFVMEQEA